MYNIVYHRQTGEEFVSQFTSSSKKKDPFKVKLYLGNLKNKCVTSLIGSSVDSCLDTYNYD